MSKAKWKPKAIADEAKAWLAKPMNQKLFWNDPQAELTQFLNGAEIPLGSASFDIGALANRFSILAQASLLDQRDESLSYLIASLQYKLEEYRILTRLNALDRRPEKQGKVGFNEAGIFLARLIALGFFSEAESLFSRMLLDLKENLFFGIDATKATPFIFNMYAKSLGRPISFDGFEVELASLYEKLVELLPSDNLNEVASVLGAACDYQVEMGQYSDDEVDYEYDSNLDRIHPAEILAFLRLRQRMGLAVPEIEHPILDNPLAKLHEPRPFPDDSFLDRVAHVADTLLRKQESD